MEHAWGEWRGGGAFEGVKGGGQEGVGKHTANCGASAGEDRTMQRKRWEGRLRQGETLLLEHAAVDAQGEEDAERHC